MRNASCCFTGHRDIMPEKEAEIKKKLNIVISELIGRGYTHFYNGGALGFDMIAAETVIELKKSHPGIFLHIIVPCENQSSLWSRENVWRYNEILSLADEVKVLSPYYFNGCMQVRNRYMVDRSSVCIAYLERLTGGSAGTAKYAEKQGLEVINIS